MPEWAELMYEWAELMYKWVELEFEESHERMEHQRNELMKEQVWTVMGDPKWERVSEQTNIELLEPRVIRLV